PDLLKTPSPSEFEYKLHFIRDTLALSETEETWDKIAVALTAFQTLLRESGGVIPEYFLDVLRSLSSFINRSIGSERSHKSASLRLTAAEASLACLQCFNPPDLQKDVRGQEVETLIRCFATDANADIRKVGRKIFEAYSILLPGRVDTFIAPLTPTIRKYLAVSSKTLANLDAFCRQTPQSTRSIVGTQPDPIASQPGTSVGTNERADLELPKVKTSTSSTEVGPSRPSAKTRKDQAPSATKRPGSALSITIVPSRPQHDGAPRIQVPGAAASSSQKSSSNPSRPKTGPLRPEASLSGVSARPITPQENQPEQRRAAGGARRVLRPDPTLSDSQPPRDKPEELRTKPLVPPRRAEPLIQPRQRAISVHSKRRPVHTETVVAARASVGVLTTKSSLATRGEDVKSRGTKAIPQHPQIASTSHVSNITRHRGTSRAPSQTSSSAKTRMQSSIKPLPNKSSQTSSIRTSPPQTKTEKVIAPELIPLPLSHGDAQHSREAPLLDLYPATPRAKPSHLERQVVQQTPISALVESIQQGFILTPVDVFARSSSRAGRIFDIGDNVRVESLGFEGVLRFLGEIEGKSGLFAGVELGGGFAGKGKNNGTVNGKRYFACAPNCGVFIIASKLSPPTIGANSTSRPSSVASFRNGRATSSISGRVTPSLSTSSTVNGRKTPSNGRVTPGLPSGRITPSASSGRRTPSGGLPATRTRTTTITSRSAVTNSGTSSMESMITPGSRASKYVGMTAKQLSSRTPTRNRMTNTPRARLSSAASMPPPSSPSTLSRRSPSVSLNDPIRSAGTLFNDLSANQRAIQEMIDKVARPASSASVLSNGAEMQLQQVQLESDRLQSRLNALEDENKRLQSSFTAAGSSVSSLNARVDGLKQEREQSLARVTELEASLRAAERGTSEKELTIESLQRLLEQSVKDNEKTKCDGEVRIRDLQSRIDDKETLATQLKELIDAKEGQQTENDAVLAAKSAEIAVLEARVQKAYTELEEERRELGGQVDELRKAGQETIALYEERLSAADSRRYEMEDFIASLQEQLQAQARPISPSTMARQATTALEIDNESLREQIQHLQKKLSTLEDLLEDARLATEREENAGRERLMQYSEREDAIHMKTLEENVEQTLLREEQALEAEEAALNSAPDDVATLQKTMREMRGKYDIYREDELEREVARLQERLARNQKKSSKGLSEEPTSSVTTSLSSVSSSASSRPESVMSDTTSRSGSEDICEICEKPGHDIFSCDLLKEDRPLGIGSASDFLTKSATDDLFCEDCEEHGHTAANCPHSLDVF
ncbi:uncharacterized protein PHACADRAFT_96626, partial [Phanerochaete carnosa HHB-10118-sp]